MIFLACHECPTHLRHIDLTKLAILGSFFADKAQFLPFGSLQWLAAVTTVSKW